MEKISLIYPADVKSRLYEAGVFKENEDETPDDRERAENLLGFLFDAILPRYGMVLRKQQKELSLMMLRALQGNKLALCEAEVGIGKTHAYILALTIHNLFSARKAPAVISTSTIALQKALTEEYIPQISAILQECRIITEPLSFAVRKGKGHYVCDSRLKIYEASIRHLRREQDADLLTELGKLWGAGEKKLDLDGTPLTPYIKKRINVSCCRDNCPNIPYCRFRHFKKKCLSYEYDFQITNHNFILAEVIGRKQGHKALLPDYRAIVFDESHQLLEAARQMYSTGWEEQEITELVRKIKIAGCSSLYDGKKTEKLALLCGQLENWNRQIFKRLAGNPAGGDAMPERMASEDELMDVRIGRMERFYLRKIIDGLSQLPLFYKASGGTEPGEQMLRRQCRNIIGRLEILADSSGFVCWIEYRSNGSPALCAMPIELAHFLFHDVWNRRDVQNRRIPALITSGTMSVQGNFTHFKNQIGLQYAPATRIVETVRQSPFDYRKHGLLYIPERMPFPDIRNERYIQAVAEETTRIVRAAHGHTLILFTSYWLMERIFYHLKEEIADYPLFLMGKGRLDAIGRFRKSGNGVLFASDSGGEGIDLAGDILSCLIVVKLPFPVPSPMLRYQQKQFELSYDGEGKGFDAFKKKAILPEMLIKLRQWIGRGIRREDDTAVFAILDSRASLRGRYRGEILNTLPAMPVTDRVEDIAEFMIRNKSESYFL